MTVLVRGHRCDSNDGASWKELSVVELNVWNQWLRVREPSLVLEILGGDPVSAGAAKKSREADQLLFLIR